MTGAQRVAKRRAALRAQGLKPRTFWLPVIEPESFRKRVAEQCERLNRRGSFDEDMAFIEAIRYIPEDDYDWGPGGPP
jgi:hypothetical protein